MESAESKVGTGQQTGPDERSGRGRVCADQHNRRAAEVKRGQTLRNNDPFNNCTIPILLPQPPSTFPTNQRTHRTRTNQALSSEDCFVSYRSRSLGWSDGEADVIVHPDWTGPSCGPPSWAGYRQRPARPAHTTCLGLGRWKPRWNCHSECQDSDSENESLDRRSSCCGKRGEGARQAR